MVDQDHIDPWLSLSHLLRRPQGHPVFRPERIALFIHLSGIHIMIQDLLLLRYTHTFSSRLGNPGQFCQFQFNVGFVVRCLVIKMFLRWSFAGSTSLFCLKQRHTRTECITMHFCELKWNRTGPEHEKRTRGRCCRFSYRWRD